MSTPTTTPTTTSTKTVNPLRELAKYGQSVWLDYIRRNLITSGELKRLIDDDGLGGGRLGKVEDGRAYEQE